MDRVIRETEDVIQRTVVGWSGGGGWYLRGLGGGGDAEAERSVAETCLF
jgi:hypothetical protein